MISLVLAWIPLTSTLKLAAENDEYTHILLALPVSLALVYASWASVRRRITTGHKQGLILFVISALIAITPILLASRIASDLRLSLEMLALVTCWIGIFVYAFGPAASRAVLFPLCFLYWMVPMPEFLLDSAVRWLQNGSAFCAQALFGAAGVPVLRDDLLLTIPGLTIEVARECSSIRSSTMLLVTTMVLAQLFLRSPFRKALVVAIAVPLSVAKNGLRIFTISMLGTRVNPGFLHGRLHRQGGIVFFLASLLIVALLLWLLGRSEKQLLPNAAVGATA
ncbi:MAG TPA: exosortase/archaeosortase family protein [Terriglobales bacterium]|nr:exosortase/archaeosortase family protein [Terriglobales bacterium]